MNTEQLKGVVAVAEEGSVSRAAKRLYLSQPNLSSLISALEKEVGFRIFERSNQGMEPTELGNVLIRHARSILSYSEDILSLSASETNSCRFRLLAPRLIPVNRAFVRFCAAHQDDARINISKHPASVDVTVQMIYRNLADYGLGTLDGHRIDEIKKLCDNRNIRMRCLKEIGLTIVFSKDHPLEREEDLATEAFNYPLVISPNYPDPESMSETVRYINAYSLDHVKEKIIVAEDWDTRFELLSQGVGYMVCTPPTQEVIDKWNLTAKPLEDLTYTLCSFVSEDKKRDKIILEFEKYLKEELKD